MIFFFFRKILDQWFAVINSNDAELRYDKNQQFRYTYEKILYVLGDTPENYYQIGMILLYLYLEQINPFWKKPEPAVSFNIY